MKLGVCAKCSRSAQTAIQAGEVPLCAYHYVEQADEECLRSRIQSGILSAGKVDEPKKIQKEIKRQRLRLYSEFQDYFAV